ncbi:MAG TPA: hypothetical protein DCF68_05185 [Cyanothece sp. UBA12306]|nr:hypothetical protein [Cyanothece sp. UBA12306]
MNFQLTNPLITYQSKQQIYFEIYVKYPTQFILNNWTRLLQNSQFYPKNVVIILFFSELLISPKNSQVIAEKNRLKNEFLQLAKKIKLAGHQDQKSIEIIDPQDGTPTNSIKGEIAFDIVAVVYQSLGLSFSDQDGCRVLHHPIAKTAVYPTILLSDAGKKELQSLIEKILV